MPRVFLSSGALALHLARNENPFDAFNDSFSICKCCRGFDDVVCHQVGSCCPSKFSFCRPPSGRISTNIDCCVTWWPIMIVRLVSTDSRFYKPILPTTLLLLLLTKQSTSIRSTSSIPVVDRHKDDAMKHRSCRRKLVEQNSISFVFIFSCWLNMKNESIILWRVSSIQVLLPIRPCLFKLFLACPFISSLMW